MEDPSFIPPDAPPSGASVHRRLWLMSVLLVVAGVWLAEQALQPRQAQPLMDLKISALSPIQPPCAPPPERASSDRFDAKYLRQVRQTRHLYQPIIQKVAHHYEVDPALVKAIIMAESAYDPRAVSQRGALGLMQLMPSTAQSLGVADGFDPEHNITAGVRYFRQLMDLVADDPALALAAYNAGPANVRRYNGIPPYETTRRYVKKVLAYYRCYRHVRQMEGLTRQG
jgi:soluble lytic murein transglycosylase-like protein